MALESGTQLGHYEISDQIGKGGMGEVYRARDTKLGREVAIKVLPSEFSRDEERLARLEREARMLAALNHPNIAAIHGLEESDDTRFLVLELVEGDTLAARLKRGAIPPEEALKLALQIAEALEAAHDKGVIHRDLKPANIKITPEGRVKVLDFGLAKAFTADQADVNLSNSPTLSMAATQQGLVLGTAAYMSPEQAEGEAADTRSDIWSFGVVLFEMLTGQQAFDGKTVARVLAAVLNRDPEWNSLPINLHPRIRALLERLLEKDHKDRLSGISDARVEIRKVLSDSGGVLVQPHAEIVQAAPQSKLPWFAAAALGVVLVAFAAWTLTRPESSVPLTVSRFLLTPADDAPLVSVSGYDLAISPDGTEVVYLGDRPGGGRALYRRSIGGLEASLIPGTEMPGDFTNANPFFSWDGTSIGFRSPGTGIMRVSLDGGPPIPIADDEAGFVGATWGPDDTVVMAVVRNTGSGLYRVSANGGDTLEEILPVPDPGVLFAAPSMLPGGHAVLFYRIGLQEMTERVAVLDLISGEERILVEGGANPLFTTSEHLVFVRGTTLMGVGFDPERFEVYGTPTPVLPGVRHPGLVTAADYAVSRNGTLIYAPAPETVVFGNVTRPVTPVWVDRDGVEEPAIDTPIVATQPRLSPDGNRLALVVGVDNRADIWIYDLTGRPPINLTDSGVNVAPLWYPDGTRVAFASNRTGLWEVYTIPADGSVLDPELLETGISGTLDLEMTALRSRVPVGWLPDGRLLLSVFRPLGGGGDLVAVPIGGTSPGTGPEAVVRTDYSEGAGSVSPDGRWLAYESDRSGTQEIWVQPAMGGTPVRVSENGGRLPVWSRNSRELYYRDDDRMLLVGVHDTSEFAFDPATEMFDREYYESYDVAPDGRFLMIPAAVIEAEDSPDATSIVVVQNWLQELREQVPIP